MIIHTEIYRGEAYLLLKDGKVWRVRSRYGDSPLMELMGHVDYQQIKRLTEPRLSTLFPGIFA